MSTLNEIAKLVTSRLRKNVATTAFWFPDSQPDTLFRGLAAGHYPDDDTAAAHLFGSNAADRRYISLKSKLANRLMRLLLFLDLNKGECSPAMKARYYCNRMQVCIKLLAAFGKRNSAAVLAGRLLRICREYHITEIRIYCLQLLRSKAALDMDEPRFEACEAELLALLELQRQECYARELTESIQLKFSHTLSSDAELLQEAEKNCRTLNKLRGEFDSRTLHLYYFRLKSLIQEIAQDHRATLNVCDELEEYFERNPQFGSNARLAELAVNRLHCCLYLKSFCEGRRFAERGLALLQPASFNWFTCMEHYFLLEMHAGNYGAAYRLYRKAAEHQCFQPDYPHRLEKWKLFEAYLRFALEHLAEYNLAPASSTFDGKFNVYKFLNEVPMCSRDKRGYNVAVLIVHIVFLLKHNDFDTLLDRANNLNWYCSTYLRSELHYRSYYFIRLIQVVISNLFDPEAIEPKSQPYLKRLAGATPDFDGKFDTLEVIPFENLWTMIMNELRRIEGQGSFIRIRSAGKAWQSLPAENRCSHTGIE